MLFWLFLLAPLLLLLLALPRMEPRLRWWLALPLAALYAWAAVSTFVVTDGGASFAFVTAAMIGIPYGAAVLAGCWVADRRRATP